MDHLDSTQRAAEAQFSQQSQRYAKGHILKNIEDVVETLAAIELPTPADVLDVACGAGHTGLHLASLGHSVVCADLTAAMLERTQEAAAARGLPITTRRHPAEAMPYETASFDLVTCRVAPHHFSAPGEFVKEAARVLRAGGWFLLIDGTVPDDDTASAEWLNRLEKLRDPSHAQLLSPREWSRLCGEARLSIVQSSLREKKQPDLEWYFETAATPPANREAVREMVATASEKIRETYKLGNEDGRIVWRWPMLSLVARRAA